MGLIYPPTLHQVGTAHVFNWNPPLAANLIGGPANFAGVVGGESVDIAVGAGAPSTISLVGGDTTAAAVAARINATFAGLATDGLAPNAYLSLSHASRIRLTAYGGVGDYAKIGLPISDRDTAGTVVDTVVAPFGYGGGLDNADIRSQAATIPDGASKLLLVAEWSGGTSGLPEVGFVLEWGDGATSWLETVTLEDMFSTGEGYVLRRTGERLYYYNAAPGASRGGPEIDIPVGATQLTIRMAGHLDKTVAPYSLSYEASYPETPSTLKLHAYFRG